ncbi:hypothetical protein ACFGVR_06585 [Mucilaginibacter sp. AW1-3]
MLNSNSVVHTFCTYEIKRHTFKPYVFRWTKFHEDNSDFPEIQVNIAEGELIICSTIIDSDNYSILTTQRIITKESNVEEIRYMTNAISYHMPLNYKFEKFGYIFGSIKFRNGDETKYFLETGKASMVMVYGIKTLIWSQQLTDAQMVNLMRIWDKRANS